MKVVVNISLGCPKPQLETIKPESELPLDPALLILFMYMQVLNKVLSGPEGASLSHNNGMRKLSKSFITVFVIRCSDSISPL
jgi:hypothetical protein